MKKTGFIAEFREDFEIEKKLSDPEYRMWRYLLRMGDWDKRHKNYGLVITSYEEIKEDMQCCKGKVSRIINGLVDKGFIKHKRRNIEIVNFEKYQKDGAKKHHKKVQEIKQRIHNNEQCVHPNELDVHNIEQKVSFPTRQDISKETIKKDKENLIKRMDMSNLSK